MTEYVEWLRIFISHHQSIEYIIIFFGSAFGGELAIFTLAFLAAQNVVSTFSFIVLSFLGTFFSNTLWFLLGRTMFVNRIILHRYANTTISVINEAVTRISRGSHFTALTVIKFIFGTPFLLIMYVNKTKLTFKQFIYYESVAIFLSLLILIPIGYVSGLGFTYFAGIFQNLYSTIGFILFVAVVIVVVQLRLKKILTEKKK